MKKENLKSNSSCIFFGHQNQITSFAILSNEFRNNDVETICLVIGKRDYQEAMESKSFSVVIDLQPDERLIVDQDKHQQSVEYLREIDKNSNLEGISYDVTCDRYFRGVSSQDVLQSELTSKWDLRKVYNFLAEVGRSIETILVQYSPSLIYLESNNSVYRLAKRIAALRGVPSGYLMIAKGWEDRVYFEQGLALNWKECRQKYEKFISEGIDDEIQKICFNRLREAMSSAERPDSYLSFHYGPNTLFDRITTKKTLNRSYKVKGETWRNNPKTTPSSYATLLSKIRRYKRQKKAFKYLQKISARFEDLPEIYITYFLHVQPEITVEESALIYSDQVSTIRNIASMLPVGVGLAVKEHRPIAGKRNIEFYSELYHTPNVYVFTEEVHSHSLIAASSGVITLTGTVALEALMYGKNVMVLGEVFFNSFKGIRHPEGWNNIRETLNSESFYLTEDYSKESVLFYAATYLSSFEGCTYGIGGDILKMTKENTERSAQKLMYQFFYEK